MNDDPHREPRAILEALSVLEAQAPEDALAAPAEEGLAPAGDEARETLRRLSVETLGLLAYDAEPVEPRAGARERLLGVLRSGARKPEPADDTRAVPLTRTSEAPAAARPDPRPAPPRASRPEPRRAPWLATFAASLLLLAVAGLSGWLYLELDRTQEALARLESERARLAQRLDAQEDLIRRAGGSGELLRAVATPGVQVCALRPVGDPPMMPRAYAVLYMAPGSDEWYLLASNLEPAEGVYVVWLNTPDGALPAGVLEAGEADTLEFRLPPPLAERRELMLSIAVTIEPSPESPEPDGPMVLFGDERMTVL